MIVDPKFIFILVFAFSFLIPSVLYAQNLRVVSPESSFLVYAGETKRIEIPIKNEGDQTDTIYISVWPTQWIDLDKYWMVIGAGETKLVSFFITVPDNTEEGRYIFTISIQSLNTNENSTDSLFLNVKRRSDVFISEI